jgi:hypothetical protein
MTFEKEAERRRTSSENFMRERSDLHALIEWMKLAELSEEECDGMKEITDFVAVRLPGVPSTTGKVKSISAYHFVAVTQVDGLT